MSSIHSLLDKNDWDLNEIKLSLENDPFSVDNVNTTGLAPLHRVIKDKICSIEFIKCVLRYGANPNFASGGNLNNHPMFLALRYRRDKETIRLLLEAGARAVNIYDQEGHSPLCIALRYDPATDLIQMLLKAGCSPKKHTNHVSPLLCAMNYPGAKLKADICELLLSKDTSFLAQDRRQTRSFMCYALSWDAEPKAIKLLLEAGCSLDDCQDHYSALGCATDHSGLLKTGTVQLLLDAGVKAKYVRKNSQIYFGESLMHKVLETLDYEEDTIKLLFEYDNVLFPDGWPTYGLLHRAVENLHCKPKVLQYLIDEGANVEEVEYGGQTALHLAVKNNNCQQAVIHALLSNGCPVNKGYGMLHCTALKIALQKDRNLSVVEELLKWGARLAAVGDVSEILQKALEKLDTSKHDMFITKYELWQEKLNFVKTLLKYAYLENPKFDIKALALGRKHYSLFSNLYSECMREIKILKSTNVYQFVSRYSDYKPKAKGNQLLKVPSVNTFSVYFDVLCITYGREAMETRLLVQPMYCISYGFNSNASKIILNYDIVRKIAGLLEDEDLFSLLVALYNPDKPTYYTKEKIPNGKRSSEESAELCKRSRQNP